MPHRPRRRRPEEGGVRGFRLPIPRRQQGFHQRLGQGRRRVQDAVTAAPFPIDLEPKAVPRSTDEAMALPVRMDPPDRIVLECAAGDDRQKPPDHLLDLGRPELQGLRGGARRAEDPGEVGLGVACNRVGRHRFAPVEQLRDLERRGGGGPVGQDPAPRGGA